MKKYQMASTMRSMSKSLPPSRTAPQFVVRFPSDDMRNRIKLLADQGKRSMNAQIVLMLEDYLREVDREEWENSPERRAELEAMNAEFEGSLSRPIPVPKPRQATDVKQAIEEASERGAEAAIARLLKSLKTAELSGDHRRETYFDRVMRAFGEMSDDGGPPKRGSLGDAPKK